jgi:multiple sugar transport system substrate-binding protein
MDEKLISTGMRYKAKFILICTLWLLYSCSKQTQKITLTLFTWTSYEEYKANLTLVSNFQKMYPRVKVKIINDPTTAAMDKLQTMIAGGVPPDVMSIHGAFFIPLASRGALLDLEKYVVADKELDLLDFYPRLLKICRYKDKLYSLPRYASVYVLFYNKDLFDRNNLSYPNENWTWRDYLNAAIKITKDTDNDGRIDIYGCVIDFWGARIYPWLWQNNGDVFNENKTECILNSKECVEAIQFLVDLQYKYRVTPQTLPNEYKNNVEMFVSGKVGMFISGAWDIQKIRKSLNFSWDIAPLPKNKTRATLLGTENYAISSKTKYPNESYLLLKYLVSKEAQKFMIDTLEKQPSRISVSKYYLLKSTGYNRRVLVDALNYGKEPPNIPEWNQLLPIFQTELEYIWVGKKSVVEGLSSATEKINQMIKKYP